MGFDLFGQSRSWAYNNAAWCLMLNLAVRVGWQPRGTMPPEHHEGPWSGEYASNSGQQVSEEDTKDSAAALRRSIHTDDLDAATKHCIEELAVLAEEGPFEIW